MILLDTCALLFWCDGRELPNHLVDQIRTLPCLVSSLTAWEIGIKYHLGKLPLGSPPDQWWPAICERLELEQTEFTSNQALSAAALPSIHNDPFDRGLIATAIELKLPLATVDPIMSQYAAKTSLKLA